MSECPYTVLGLKRGASLAAIKAAYRRQAQANHPDRHGDKSPEERNAYAQQFQRAQAAYDLLMNREQRAYYDAHGETTQAAAERAGPEVTSTLVAAFEAVIPDFGLGRWAGGRRDEDIVKKMRLHLTDKMEGQRSQVQRARGLVADLRKFEGRILCRGCAENAVNRRLAAEIVGLQALGAEAEARAAHFKACLVELQFWSDGGVDGEGCGAEAKTLKEGA